MKKILFLCTSMLFLHFSNAQYALPKGKAQLNAGLGLSGWGVPVYLGFDFGIHKDMSLGLDLSFRRYNEKYKTIVYQHNVTGIGVNWNYHFNSLLSLPTEWDFYAGVNAGYFIWSSPNIYPGSNVNGTGLGGQIGFRYYFNDKVGLNIEGGSGSALTGGKLGLTIKL